MNIQQETNQGINNESVKIEVQSTKEDFIKHLNYFFFKRKTLKRTGIILLIALLFLNNQLRSKSATELALERASVMAIILFLIFFIIPYAVARIKLLKAVFGKRIYTVTEDGINIETLANSIFYNWSRIKSVEIVNNDLTISIDKKIYLIPNRFFNSETQINNFKKFIDSRIPQISRDKSAVKKLYYWGLLGFVPNIGFITGIVLLIKGTSKYKDRTLIIIGISDILFTIIFWSIFIPISENSKSGIKSRVEFTQTQLNTVFKTIEFYKLEKGTYPDSLQQIENYKGFVLISDPINLKFFSNKSSNFYYKKVNEKYYLFSAGLDGILFTKDDIYPLVNPSDTNKFGIILRQ
jgi:hypothetical protein